MCFVFTQKTDKKLVSTSEGAIGRYKPQNVANSAQVRSAQIIFMLNAFRSLESHSSCAMPHDNMLWYVIHIMLITIASLKFAQAHIIHICAKSQANLTGNNCDVLFEAGNLVIS